MLWQVSYAHADRVLVTTGSALALGTGLSFMSEKSPLSKSLYSSGFRDRKVCTDNNFEKQGPHVIPQLYG